MATSTNPPTHTTILDILEHSAYNPGIVPQLESYVDAQLNQIIEGNPNLSNDYCYSFDANRTLLKLYQFFPHLANDHIISKIFFLALLEFPSTDFTALACLVSEKIQSREPCATLMRYDLIFVFDPMFLFHCYIICIHFVIFCLDSLLIF